MADTGTTVEESRTMKSAPAPLRFTGVAAKKRSYIDLTIQVRDTDLAIREIEERLKQVNARIIERLHREGREFLKAEIAAQKFAAFLDRLEALGKVDLDKNTLDVPDGKVTVNIKIVTNP